MCFISRIKGSTLCFSFLGKTPSMSESAKYDKARASVLWGVHKRFWRANLQARNRSTENLCKMRILLWNAFIWTVCKHGMNCGTARQLLTATFPTNRKVEGRQIAKNDIIISVYVTRQVDLCQPLWKRKCVNLPPCVCVSLCVSDLLHLEDSSTLGLSHNRETKARWRITNDFMAKQPLKFFQYVALKTTEQIEIRRWVGFEMRFFFFCSPFLSPPA